MWGRKDDEAPANKPAAVAAAPAARPVQRPSERPSGTQPVQRSASKSAAPGAAVNAQVGKSLKVKGSISGEEDLYIDGVVEGKVTLENNSLTIGPNGKVVADVNARSIVLLGSLQGNVRAGERIEIRKTGSLEGDLVTSRIVIEDGAVFRGSIDIEKPSRAGAAGSKPNGSGKPAKPTAESAPLLSGGHKPAA